MRRSPGSPRVTFWSAWRSTCVGQLSDDGHSRPRQGCHRHKSERAVASCITQCGSPRGVFRPRRPSGAQAWVRPGQLSLHRKSMQGVAGGPPEVGKLAQILRMHTEFGQSRAANFSRQRAELVHPKPALANFGPAPAEIVTDSRPNPSSATRFSRDPPPSGLQGRFPHPRRRRHEGRLQSSPRACFSLRAWRMA